MRNKTNFNFKYLFPKISKIVNKKNKNETHFKLGVLEIKRKTKKLQHFHNQTKKK